MMQQKNISVWVGAALSVALAFVLSVMPLAAPLLFVAHAETSTSTPQEASSSSSNGGSSGAASTTGATISTGDATALGSVNNNVNTNTTQSQTASSAPATTPETSTTTPETTGSGSGTETASSTPPTGDATSTPQTANATSTPSTATSTPDTATSTPSSSQTNTAVADTNAASTTNSVGIGASTGGNSAGGGGNTSITTGSALASANVLNVLNLNLVDSEGLFVFLNRLFGLGGIDLGGLNLSYFFGDASSTPCSLLFCDSSLTVQNANSATSTNDVNVTASTGGNTATSTDAARISTGNAYASANVVNVINTNLVGSHYLLLALNNFGDLSGDITLPDAQFFERLLALNGRLSASTTIANANAATLDSTSTAQASTGGNSATSTDGAATVQTGSALSNSTTYNQVNTNLTGGTTVFMLVNIFGNWTGSVQGLPPGLSWVRTPNGIEIVGGASSLSQLSSSGSAGGAAVPGASLDVSNTNAAALNNGVQVYALTGQNYADASGTAAIATGNAYASANVVNLVNTNIIGQNWVLAIMNIFGDWNGDLAFGRPDLWLGTVAQAPNPAPPGSSVPFTFTVSNRGQVEATDVTLTARFDRSLLTFASGTTVSGGTRWDLGAIPAGATKQFTFDATVGTPPSGDTVAVPVNATLTEAQNDANAADNTDSVTITVGDALPSPSGGIDIGPYLSAPQLTVTKTQSVSATTSPASVDYKVVVQNAQNAGPAYHAMLADDLRDPSGKTIYHNSWDLGTLAPGDEVILTYTVQYDASTTPGAYVDTSTVTGWQNYTSLPYANAMAPASASSTLDILPPPQVLGASTSTVAATCEPLLTSYLMQGQANNPAQVRLLQGFLNDTAGSSLTVNGQYGASTIDAVKQFQLAHQADILDPWGLSQPTGNVYFTTEREVNVLNCNATRSFTLSPPQVEEIAAYRGGNVHASAASDTGPVEQAAASVSAPTAARTAQPLLLVAGPSQRVPYDLFAKRTPRTPIGASSSDSSLLAPWVRTVLSAGSFRW